MNKEGVRKTKPVRFPGEDFLLILPGKQWAEWFIERESTQLNTALVLRQYGHLSLPCRTANVSIAMFSFQNWAPLPSVGLQSPLVQWHASEGSPQKLQRHQENFYEKYVNSQKPAQYLTWNACNTLIGLMTLLQLVQKELRIYLKQQFPGSPFQGIAAVKALVFPSWVAATVWLIS